MQKKGCQYVSVFSNSNKAVHAQPYPKPRGCPKVAILAFWHPGGGRGGQFWPRARRKGQFWRFGAWGGGKGGSFGMGAAAAAISAHGCPQGCPGQRPQGCPGRAPTRPPGRVRYQRTRSLIMRSLITRSLITRSLIRRPLIRRPLITRSLIMIRIRENLTKKPGLQSLTN